MSAALATLDAAGIEALDHSKQECLAAWLSAFRQHWPLGFETCLGDLGARTQAALASRPLDANRYLKLRRIAIENLAGAL